MDTSRATFETVKSIIVKTLGIEERAETLNASTQLFGGIPELDSFAVVELAVSLEEQFRFQIDDSEFNGDIFETVGSLVEFVEEKTGSLKREDAVAR